MCQAFQSTLSFGLPSNTAVLGLGGWTGRLPHLNSCFHTEVPPPPVSFPGSRDMTVPRGGLPGHIQHSPNSEVLAGFTQHAFGLF